MARNAYARRTDVNQASIVRLLRKLGASVLPLSGVGDGCPDLLVAVKDTALCEVKDGNKPLSQQRLTPDQVKFHSEWKGKIVIVRNEVDAIQLFYTLRDGEK